MSYEEFAVNLATITRLAASEDLSVYELFLSAREQGYL